MRGYIRALAGLALAGLLLPVIAGGAPRPTGECWVGTWGYVPLPPPPGMPAPPPAAAPTPSPIPFGGPPPAAPGPRPTSPPLVDNPGNVPVDLTGADLANVTVRQLVRLSQGGSRLRLRLSNESNPEPLPLGAVHVAEAAADGAIVPGTDRVVTFDGATAVTLPAGAPVLSDPIDLPTRALERLCISTLLPGVVSPRDPRPLFQYVAGRPGDFTAANALPGVRLMRIGALVTLVEVQAPAARVVVTLGDSITQGSRSTANAFRSWPDRLAERLAEQHWAVVNAGIGGNRLLRYGAGPSALARLDRDVLSVPGVRAIILLEGINDIGTGLGNLNSSDPVTADALETADRQIIARAHEHGIRVIGATLTPYQGAGYASPAGEMVREALNHWIRSSNAFDAVIDFAPVLADPANPLAFDRRYNDGDHLHPNDAGYRALGDAIDLSVILK